MSADPSPPRRRPVNATSVSSAEELLVNELEEALAAGDLHFAKQLVADPIYHSLQKDAGELVDVLFACCERGDARGVSLLIEHGGVPHSPRIAADDSTPLHVACKHCRASVVKVLLGAGADPEARMRHQVTPLLMVCVDAS